MCLRSTCASLWRLPSLSSSAIVLSYLSVGFFLPPSLPSLLLLTCICLAYSTFYLSHLPHPPPHNCHTNEPHANPIDKHARVSTKPCSRNQKCTNWNAGTVKIICKGSDSARVVLSCTATHCVYAKPLSLLVERCYALLSSGEGKHPVTSTGYRQLPTPPPATPAEHRAVTWAKLKGDICEWDFNDHHDTRGIYLIEKWGRFLLVVEDQKWKVKLPRCKRGPRDTCETEIKDPPFLKQNILDNLF